MSTSAIEPAEPIRPELMAAVAYARSMGYTVESVATGGTGATLHIARALPRLMFTLIWRIALLLPQSAPCVQWAYDVKLIRQPVIWIGADVATGRIT